MPAIAVHTLDSAVIRVARVLCIFFMMSVHIFPGPSNASFVTHGEGAFIGFVWLTFLGRASVTTLSLVSGYLLVSALQKYRLEQIARDRARVLLMPMAFWNMITLIAMLISTAMGISLSGRILPVTLFEIINSITGLFGPSINLSLFFLRDLFVSSMLLALLWRYIQDHLEVTLVAVVVVTVFDLTAPVVFRPTILLFMMAGCALRVKRIHISSLAVPQTLVYGLLISGAVYLVCTFIALDTQPIVEVKNIAKRTMLLFVIIALAVAIGRSKHLQSLFDRLEPVTFLAYLSHTLLAKLIWIAMSAAGINLMERSYLIYFFTAPIIVFFIALPMQRLILTLPALPQILLRGKSA